MDINEYKEILIDKLESIGIPDYHFIIKEVNESQKNYRGVLGAYSVFSNLRGKPRFFLNVDCHKRCLEDMHGDLDFNLEVTQNVLTNSIMDTLLHEYGHAIEEFFNHSEIDTQEFKKAKEILLNEFNDMEDFAETFGRLANQSDVFSDKKTKNVWFIKDTFRDIVFTKEAVKELEKPNHQREFECFLEVYAKSLVKLNDENKSFDQCKKMSEKLFDFMTEKSNAKIIQLSGFNSDLENANKKWQNVNNRDFIIHYAILCDDKVYDLTFKQFDKNSEFPLVKSKDEYLKDWKVSLIVKEKIPSEDFSNTIKV